MIMTNEKNMKNEQTANEPENMCSPEWQAYIDEKVKQVPKGKTFIFYADTHWTINSKKEGADFVTKVIKYTKDKLGIKTVIHGGDLFNSYSVVGEDNAQAALDVVNLYMQSELKGVFGTDWLYAIGNHEGNYVGYNYAANRPDLPDRYLGPDTPARKYLISETDLYNSTVKLLDGTIVYDEEGIATIKKLFESDPELRDLTEEAMDMMRLHYYRDDPVNKIRYIMLNTGAIGYIQAKVLKKAYVPGIAPQPIWFAKTLKSTPDDYDVVIAGHQLTDDVEMLETMGNGYKDYNEFILNIYSIISAFKIGSSVSTTYYEDADTVFKRVVNATRCDNFCFDKKFTGTIFTLCGHSHTDGAYYVNNADRGYKAENADTFEGTLNPRAVLGLKTGTASRGHHDSSCVKIDGYSMTREMPTNTKFDIVTITDKGVVLTRIGAGKDRFYDDN